MKFSFDAARGPVLVSAKFRGPQGELVLRLALDTGATTTVLSWEAAELLGYDPSASKARVRITTGSGVEFAPRISIDRLEALGIERLAIPLLCHTLPPSAGVDGLLGLDFLRGQRIVLDFRSGVITLD
jgi:predicted aspartyl protease